METHKKQSMITSHVHLAAQGRGGGGVKPYCLTEPETECYRNIVWVWTYYDDVFLCTWNFYLAAQGGGGGLNPLNPPFPPVDPPLKKKMEKKERSNFKHEISSFSLSWEPHPRSVASLALRPPPPPRLKILAMPVQTDKNVWNLVPCSVVHQRSNNALAKGQDTLILILSQVNLTHVKLCEFHPTWHSFC